MPVNAVSMNNIPETSYLNTDNTAHYRTIMRVFYDESEKTHYQLDKETVLEKLHQISAFADYTMEQLLPHLNQLVIWKNLTPIQDPSRANTIAEYKNNQFRYLMSGAAVEVERMTLRLEALVLESASLSIYLFPRIQNALMEIESLQTAQLKDVDEWWQNLQEDFKRLNQNYQDYLRDFYSTKAEHMMRSAEFIAHKEHVVKYLRDFVQELQSRGGKIEKVLLEIPKPLTDIILDKIVASELEKPRPSSERPPNFEVQIKENIRGKWHSLYEWFVSEAGRLSESQYVLETTNEVIRKIIQNANLI
ncbi:MAG: TIGR02677 family protein, partial [Ethanoligenens sp.]